MSRVGERDNPISVRSKRRITDALLDLMKTEPFSKITIKDIVEKAGLTRQTFYHNFETKEDVLLYKEDELIAGFVQYLFEHQIVDWEDVICFFFRYWQEHADFMQLLMKNDLVYLLSMRLPTYFQTVNDIHFEKTDLTDTEARLWYAFVGGAVVSVLTSWLSSSGGLSARELAKMLTSMMDGSFMARNGFGEESGARDVVSFMAQGSLE